MRNLFILYLLFACLLNTNGQYHAVYINDEKLSKIKLDGDTSDWNWVPHKYFITTASMNEYIASKRVDGKNWDCKIIIGWNDIKNWIYIVAVVRDNIRNTDCIPGSFWLDDHLEIVVNPDNLGGSFDQMNDRRRFNSIKFHSIDKKSIFEIEKGPLWITKMNYMDWGIKTFYDNKLKTNITVYEVGLHLWDKWNDVGPKQSCTHKLMPNQTIRLSISSSDVDNITDQDEAIWAMSTGRNYPWNADFLCKFSLDYPVKNDVSWEGILNVLRLK